MRILYCKQCGCEIFFNAKSSFKYYCDTCRRKKNSLRVMQQRKLKNPNIELGVGSGNSSKNKLRPLTTYTYRKIKKDYCELCGTKNNLLVHHKDHNRNNNSTDNLITICKSCHQKHHCKRDDKGRYISQKAN